MKILVIEDDPSLNKNISEALRAESYTVVEAFDGLLAERFLKKESFDCVVMDINLPGKSGYELCRNFRTYNTHTPVIILTAFSELEDKITAYDYGADDYLTKPFFMRELLLRIKAILKRSSSKDLETSTSQTLSTGDISLNKTTKKVYRQDQEINLTPREFQILELLLEQNGDFVSKDDLIAKIWGGAFNFNTNTIEVYISMLRNKVDKPFNTNSIKTKVGYGYYLDF
ncbi:response regulator transcription factor [Leeuwenhoekiella marinoflava]|uniref:DNA-binding response OmpR family regulator n=2 Tax=Leeuwenhoekiella marinoflava TaxID=988 RepID=A0A4Q0PN85_9FLAO|nr:response regulator transcription factor [Leeuwenhoekiella marinoflava]RXG31980.1 DNA-binding response OmpR family regulator [Leeuwenhoekiella marinoflava]SHE93716.1 DNA-binding response regulator, OmpR family, contains REC and winged-helix (wHTH) domain [Leeuwenhoekiella marinoflava DSM 3653]